MTKSAPPIFLDSVAPSERALEQRTLAIEIQLPAGMEDSVAAASDVFRAHPGRRADLRALAAAGRRARSRSKAEESEGQGAVAVAAPPRRRAAHGCCGAVRVRAFQVAPSEALLERCASVVRQRLRSAWCGVPDEHTGAQSKQEIAELEQQIRNLQELADQHDLAVEAEIAKLEAKLARMREEVYRKPQSGRTRTAGPPSQAALHARLHRAVFTDFLELHGDRAFRDDEAIVGGWARLDGRTVMVIGHQKGRDMKENLRRNFGMPHPEGYRKALRLMRLAEKFGRPVSR